MKKYIWLACASVLVLGTSTQAQMGSVREARMDAREARMDAREAGMNASGLRMDAREATQEAREARMDARMMEPGEDRQEARTEARELGMEAQEARQDANRATREARRLNAVARTETQEARQARREARETRREERRQARRAHAEESAEERAERRRARRAERWATLKEEVGIGGVEELEAPIRAELLAHAQRMAQLERISDLAATAANEPVVARIQAAMILEDNRHETKLLELTVPSAATVELTP